jgi:hypothetical protein
VTLARGSATLYLCYAIVADLIRQWGIWAFVFRQAGSAFVGQIGNLRPIGNRPAEDP